VVDIYGLSHIWKFHWRARIRDYSWWAHTVLKIFFSSPAVSYLTYYFFYFIGFRQWWSVRRRDVRKHDIIARNVRRNLRFESKWFHSCRSKMVLLCINGSSLPKNGSSSSNNNVFLWSVTLKKSMPLINDHFLCFIHLQMSLILDLPPILWNPLPELFILGTPMTSIHSLTLQLRL